MHPLLALYSLVMVTLLLVSVKANPIHFHAEHLFRRDASGQSIASLRTGVLVKNGVQTSCELALIDNKAAFVAANCVTDVNGKLDTINGYSVYYDDSNVQGNKAASASITSSSITVHPGYSTDTLANNIAILQFNPGQGVSWKNAIAVNSNAWSDTVLARRRLANVKGSQWATPLTESLSASADQCSSSSGLYAANTKDFVCSSQESVPLMSSQCNIPYGSVYGVQGTNAAIAGLYSFSVVNGGQFCSSSTVTSYYLLLADYISFAQDAIGRDVTLSFDQGYTLNNIITYSMNQGSFSSPSGTLVLTGNVFATNGNSANWVYGSYFGSQTPQSSNNNSGGSSSAQGSSGTSIASGVLIDELLSKSSALAVPTGSGTGNITSEDGGHQIQSETL
ncbi:hypothetical protein EV179_003527 [Coemansia sp. RSA 487]|nr:hypothetical protein EV179_003527 [Coemansia sp. RSA 487]